MMNTKKWLTCSCHFQCFNYEIRFVGPPRSEVQQPHDLHEGQDLATPSTQFEPNFVDFCWYRQGVFIKHIYPLVVVTMYFFWLQLSAYRQDSGDELLDFPEYPAEYVDTCGWSKTWGRLGPPFLVGRPAFFFKRC